MALERGRQGEGAVWQWAALGP